MNNAKIKIKYVFLSILIVFVLLFVRIVLINFNPFFSSKALQQQTFNVNLIFRPANFFDENLARLTNKKNVFKALVFPEKVSFNSIKNLNCSLKETELQKLFKLKKPFVLEIKNPVNLNGVFVFKDKKRYDDCCFFPTHLLGYLNKDNNGVCGLEKHFNKFLKKYSYKLDAVFQTNAKQNILNANQFKLKTTGKKNDGVVLTINSNVQYILNSLAKTKIKKGAGVVLNAKTGEILAISSFPSFNPNSVEQSLKNPDSPLLNKSLLNHSVGSIFKIVTATAALNEKISPNLEFNCPGYFKLNDVKFNCHKTSGHGVLNLENAMKNSCNPYFISLGLKVGAQKILNTAFDFGFGREIELCNGFCCPAANLPNSNMSCGELCNLSFGQGQLKASILHIGQMLLAIANDGVAFSPSILKGFVKNNEFFPVSKSVSFRALSKKNAKTLKDILQNSLKKTPASSFLNDCAGKSSTAQTGEFLNKKEKLTTWICSFFPVLNPSFVVVLLKEEGTFGMQDLGELNNVLATQLII